MKTATLNGEALRTERERAGLTQEALADASGMTKWGISKLELGTRQPSATAFKAICEALDVAPDSLLAKPDDEEAA